MNNKNIKQKLTTICIITIFFSMSLITSCGNNDFYDSIIMENLPDLGIKSIDIIDINQLKIVFTHKVEQSSAESINNYVITKSDDETDVITVNSASMLEEGGSSVILETGVFMPDTDYQITITNISSSEARISNSTGLSTIFSAPLMLDLTSVTLLQPVNGVATTSEPVFLWTSRTGATGYEIEIASDESFSDVVLSATTEQNSYIPDNSDLSGITELDTRTYYWHIKAVFSDLDGDFSNSGSFNVVKNSSPDNAAYVWSEYEGVSYGNQSAPYRSIQDAIDHAKIYDLPVVKVAGSSDDNKGIYTEDCLVVNGISLMGGYNPEDWSDNDPDTYKTKIIAAVDSAVIVPSGVLADTEISGFYINYNDDYPVIGITCNKSDATIINNVIYGEKAILIKNGAEPTITENIIHGYSTGSAYGIYVKDSSLPIISYNEIVAENDDSTGAPCYGIIFDAAGGTVENNEITCGLSSPNYGIYCNGWTSIPPTIENNNITTSDVDEATGILIVDASPTIQNNNISIGSITSSTGIIAQFDGMPSIIGNTITAHRYCDYLVGIKLSQSDTYIQNNRILVGYSEASYSIGLVLDNCRAVVTNNIIDAGISYNSTGISITDSNSVITNNIINGGSYSHSTGIYFGCAGDAGVITNNLIFTTSTSGNRYGIYEYGNDVLPVSLHNNNIFDCDSGLYVVSAGTSIFTTIANMETYLSGYDGDAYNSNISEDISDCLDENFEFLESCDLDSFTFDTAGRNTYNDTCGDDEASYCGYVSYDIDELNRTDPYSIGAFEYD